MPSRLADIRARDGIEVETDGSAGAASFSAPSVVIADGGFPAGFELIRAHICPAPEKLLARNGASATGDGLRMAQAIGASDQTIKEKPDLLRRFVRAALRGMKDIMDDPDKAADDFVKFVPEWKGKEGDVKAAFKYYATLVYPGQKVLGEVNRDRLAGLQDFYFSKGIIQQKTPVDELYTNEFVR